MYLHEEKERVVTVGSVLRGRLQQREDRYDAQSLHPT